MTDPEEERQRLAKLYAQMSAEELEEVGSDAASLTETARQALWPEFERRGIDTALLGSLAVADTVEYRELEMIRRYRDLPEALLAKTSLESTGIECFLADENIVRIDWFWSNLLGGVKLYVKPEDADAALEVLGQPAPERFEVEGVGEYVRPRCPRCDSIEVFFEELKKPIAFFSASLGVPLPLHRKGWICHSCGHQWQDDLEANADQAE